MASFLPVTILVPLTVALASGETSQQCPTGFTLAGSKCYRLDLTLSKKFTDAVKHCKTLGENVKLAEPKSDAETNAIRAVPQFQGRSFWVGIEERNGVMNQWQYESNNQPITLPSNTIYTTSSADSDCLRMYTSPYPGSTRFYYANKCTWSKNFLCEAPATGPGEEKCIEENVIFVESSVQDIASVSKCMDLCKSICDCKFFTYNYVTKACGVRTYEPSNIVSAPTQQTGTKFTLVNNHGVVFVGFAVEKSSVEECQKSCQCDPKCLSFTYNTQFASANKNVCVHNYGETKRKLTVGTNGSILSGPKFCPGQEVKCPAHCPGKANCCGKCH